MSGQTVYPTRSGASSAPSGPAGGDLGGTYPNPSVLRTRALQSATSDVSVNGAAEPTSGQVLTATGPGAAEWQTPSAGGGSVPTPGTTPTSLLTFGPNLGPVGSVFFVPNSTGVQYVGAIYGGGVVLVGSATNAPDAYGVRCDSAAVATNSCGIDGNGGTCPTTRRERRPWFWARFKLGPVATTCGWWAGLFKSGLIDHTTYPDYCLAFTCSSNAGETTWQLGSRDGATTSKTDTLVPVTADHEYSVYYQIEGASCDTVRWAIYDHTAGLFYSGSITTKANLPALTDNLGPIVHGVNVGAISHTIYLPPTPFMIGVL